MKHFVVLQVNSININAKTPQSMWVWLIVTFKKQWLLPRGTKVLHSFARQHTIKHYVYVYNITLK